MTNQGPWNTEDFETLSWHDVHVHGLQLETFNPENGTSDIVFDIDYILKWENAGDKFLFTVCKAELVFHDVSNLKLSIDYAVASAGMSPFIVLDVEREPLTYPTGHKSFRWQISLSWPDGSIEFDAPRFTQKLIGKPVIQDEQGFSSEQRLKD